LFPTPQRARLDLATYKILKRAAIVWQLKALTKIIAKVKAQSSTKRVIVAAAAAQKYLSIVLASAVSSS